MKLECSVEKIKNIITTVERMTGKNLTLPVLSSVLFTASGKNLVLRATNLSIGIEATIPAKVEEEGVFATRGDILSSLFSVTPSESSVVFEQIDGTLSIKTKNNTTQLKTIPYEDFPTLPVVEGETFTIQGKKFIEGLKAVFYSAATSDIKPEIGSIYMYPENEDLVFVATDSFRLAEKKVKIKQSLSFGGILLPFKNATELLRVLDGVQEDITIICSKNQASFSIPGMYITSRVVDGTFPDYKQILPKNATTEAVILKQDLVNALKVSNVLSDKFNQITIDINPGEKTLKLQSKNTDIGETTTNVSAALSGEDVSANFNYKYIIDSFQSVTTDSITLQLSGTNKPMILRPVGDMSFLYLVMPMNR